MDEKDIISLGETLKEGKGLKKEVMDLKLLRKSITNEIERLKKVSQEDKANFEKEKAKIKEKVEKLYSTVAELEARRITLATTTAPEIKELTKLRENKERQQAKLDQTQESINAKLSRTSKELATIAEKKITLQKIKELTDKL